MQPEVRASSPHDSSQCRYGSACSNSKPNSPSKTGANGRSAALAADDDELFGGHAATARTLLPLIGLRVYCHFMPDQQAARTRLALLTSVANALSVVYRVYQKVVGAHSEPSSSMPLVLRPEVLPHTGHSEPGSVVENSPIWSTMSLDVAVE